MTDHVEIADTWTFNRGVAQGFDAHVREQLPWYELVTSALVSIARHFIPEHGLIYDIGASNGNVGRALAHVIQDRQAELVSIEPSAEMVKTYDAPGRVICARAEAFDYQRFDLCIAMLSLMFVPPAETPALLMRLRSLIKPGGALIIVERMLPPDGYASIVTSRLTLAAKLDQGASAADVLAKELSLAGVQRPLSRELVGDGCEWFRFGDFAGWLIEPPTTRSSEKGNA